MADFLGSILGSMAAPPRASEKEIAERKKARELAKKMEEKNKQDSKAFRLKIEKRIDEFLKLPIGEEKNRRLIMETMPKYHRSVVHDVAEIAGLVGIYADGMPGLSSLHFSLFSLQLIPSVRRTSIVTV